MSANILYLDKFGKAFVPKKFRPYLKDHFLKAGYDEVPYTIFGALFWVSAVLTYFVYIPFIYPAITESSVIVFFLITFFGWFGMQAGVAAFLGLLVYFHLNVKIYNRTKLMEEKLPDYLNLVSVNLKGGMSFEKALWSAIKPEFDVLAKEITLVSKKVMTGNDVKDALMDFSTKYDSPVLRRSIDLLVGEIEGGGKIVQVIDNLVENLKKTSELRRELTVSTKTYSIFLTIIVIFIAPALFAVAYQLLQMMAGFTQNLGGTTSSNALGMSMGGTEVSIEEFKNFSYMALGIIAVFSSMIVSIINKGDIKAGLKYIPAFLISSLFFYFIFSSIASYLFSGVI